jgi:hypothetical protein
MHWQRADRENFSPMKVESLAEEVPSIHTGMYRSMCLAITPYDHNTNWIEQLYSLAGSLGFAWLSWAREIGFVSIVA